MCKRLCFLFAAMLLMVSSAVAQVTTSGMSGKITANNEEVIGATIEAVHKPSGTRYMGVTNTKGMFNILGMRSGGPYEVKISYIGYETKVVKDVTLELGETYNLSTSMNEARKGESSTAPVLLRELLHLGDSPYAGCKGIDRACANDAWA